MVSGVIPDLSIVVVTAMITDLSISRSQRRIKHSVLELSNEELVQRELQLRSRQDMLTNMWVAYASDSEHVFGDRVKQNLKLVDYELQLLRSRMVTLKLKPLFIEITKEVVIESNTAHPTRTDQHK